MVGPNLKAGINFLEACSVKETPCSSYYFEGDKGNKSEIDQDGLVPCIKISIVRNILVQMRWKFAEEEVFEKCHFDHLSNTDKLKM